MLRRLYHDQPESFAFTEANQKWAEGQITKYPEGRQASAVIPLLWRAQEQEGWVTRPAIEHIAKLNEIASRRGQTLAQMALAWVLRDGGITTALIGASRPSQVIDCVGAVGNLEFTAEELAEIDKYADEENINLWAQSAEQKKGAAQR